MNNIVSIEEIKVRDMIYEIRGKQVMLDSDLAKLYKCANGTKDINKAVNRNKERFPNDFYFQLTYEEYQNLKFHLGTSSLNNHGGVRKLPYVFTEQGIAMLASVLRSSIAAEVSIKIMRAFVMMKQYISNSLIEQKYINDLVLKDSKRIDLLEIALSNFKEKNNHIFFKGQIYDSYSLLIDIFNQSKNEIIIIDNYIDKNILDVLSEIKSNIIIITNKYNNKDFEKYQKQYNNINLIINNTFHDRFIIIDKNTLYHCGASFKDLGKKCFEISKIDDEDILEKLLNKLW